MGDGYSGPMSESVGMPQDMAAQMRRRGLLGALYSVDAPQKAINADRIQDDPVSRSNPQAYGEPQAQAPVGQSPSQRDTLADQMMAEYQRLGQPEAPPPQPSLKQQILGGLLRAAPVALGAAFGGSAGATGAAQGEEGSLQRQQRMTLAQQQMAQQHEQQRSSLRERMLQEIMTRQHQQEQEDLTNKRLAQQADLARQSQEGMEQRLGEKLTASQQALGQREDFEAAQRIAQDKAREETQARLFEQQRKLESDRFAQQMAMQSRQFGEQEKLVGMRQQTAKVTADEERRGDLANNLSENLDQLEDIVKRRPDLFGPLAGRMSGLRTWAGTSDQDLAKLKVLKEQTGLAMVGTHAMRNAQHAEKAANAIFNAQLNSPQATLAAIQEARNSLQTFKQDVLNKGGMVGGQRGGRVGGQPIVQRSRSTGQYRYSLDNGKTWQQGQPPSQ